MLGLQKKRFCHSAQNSVSIQRLQSLQIFTPSNQASADFAMLVLCSHYLSKRWQVMKLFQWKPAMWSNKLTLVAVWCSKSFFHCCNNGVKHQHFRIFGVWSFLSIHSLVLVLLAENLVKINYRNTKKLQLCNSHAASNELFKIYRDV